MSLAACICNARCHCPFLSSCPGRLRFPLLAVFLLLLGLGDPRLALAQAYVPLQITSVNVQSSDPYAGWPVSIAVNFNRVATANDTFSLSVTGPIPVGSQQMIHAGQSSATVNALIGKVTASNGAVSVTASYTDPVLHTVSSANTTSTVYPIYVSSVAVNPIAILGGNNGNATVSLSHATYGVCALYASGDHTTLGSHYEQINAGQSSGTFPFTSVGVGAGTVTVAADTSSPEIGQATGNFVCTSDTKVPMPGCPPGDRPKACLVCNGSLTADIDLLTGNAACHHHDPVATRGYPLVCNIHINSQCVETARPMGNAAFTYDIHLATQNVYNSSCVGTSHWMVVDGDGTRLDFGPAASAPTATAGIFSRLVTITGGYQLQNAGPPEDLARRGNFTYTFNSLGQLTQLNDSTGNAQALTYDSNNRLIQVFDISSQKQIAFQYNGSLISQVIENSSGVATNLSYTNGALTTITVSSPLTGTTTQEDYRYNGDGSLASVTRDADPTNAIQFTYAPYTPRDCTIPILVASGGSAAYGVGLAYGQSSPSGVERTKVTNTKGGVTTYDFDAQGNPIQVTMPLLAGATQATTLAATYDNYHQITQLTDNTGAGVVFTYDTNGFITTTHSVYGNTFRTTHSGADLTSAQTPVQNTLGVSENYTYGDPLQPHVPTAYQDASGNTWNFAHNAYGQTTQVTPPTGSPTAASTLAYDENAASATLGYLLSVADGNGNPTTFDAYDALGDLLQVSTYPIPGNTLVRNTRSFSYDAAQRLTGINYPDGRNSQIVYAGRHVDHTIDPAGTQINYSYCPTCDALTGIAGPLGWSLNWALDGDRQITDFTDANGGDTHYTYGLGGELKQLTYPDNSTISFLYNNAGLPRQMTNARGNQISLSYDNFQRLSQVSYPTSGQASTTYTYNTDDAPNTTTDGIGVTTYAYYANGWPKSVIYNYAAAGLTAQQEIDYTYYPDGSCHTMTWKSGGATVASWSYSYDAGGRLTGVTNNWSETTSWAYDGEDKLTGQTCSNGTSLSLIYNQSLGWPISAAYSNSTGNFGGYALVYDNGNNTIGHLTGVTEQDGSTINYGYNALYRLTSDTRTGTNPTAHTYGYDLAGNLTTVNGVAFAAYDAANKISTLSGGTTSYDADGNMTSLAGPGMPACAFAWDDRNKAVMQTSGGVTVSYGYAASGLRTTAQVGSGAKTFYIYSGLILLGEIQAGATTPSAVYTWGATGPVSERLIASNRSLWYAYGPQGETRQLTDSTGAVVDTYVYTAYGTPLASTGSDFNPFRFGGQSGYYTDVNNLTGTVLCGLRWYAPGIGRFLNHDPIEYAGGPNLYAYCDGDPINGLDPLGTDAASRKEWAGTFWGKASKVGLETAAGLAGSAALPANPLLGSALGVGLIDGLWAHYMEGEDAASSINTALTSGVFTYVGGKAAEKALLAILKVPAVQQFIKKFGCEGEGFLAKLIKKLSDGCFVAGTQVWLARQDASGHWQVYPAPIEQVKEGDLAVTRDPQTGRTEYKRVVKTTVQTVDSVLSLTLADAQTGKTAETITTTDAHPFMVADQGFVPAGQLALGNAIVTRAGPTLIVKSITRQVRKEGYRVYNFEVEGSHTYFVGELYAGTWVHNDCPPDGPAEPFNRLKHYGRTPTTAQKNSVPEGMLFDHDPPLAKHYYEGDGKGGVPGYKMTQAEREAYGKSISVGSGASPEQRFAQGGAVKALSMAWRKFWFGY